MPEKSRLRKVSLHSAHFRCNGRWHLAPTHFYPFYCQHFPAASSHTVRCSSSSVEDSPAVRSGQNMPSGHRFQVQLYFYRLMFRLPYPQGNGSRHIPFPSVPFCPAGHIQLHRFWDYCARTNVFFHEALMSLPSLFPNIPLSLKVLFLEYLRIPESAF